MSPGYSTTSTDDQVRPNMVNELQSTSLPRSNNLLLHIEDNMNTVANNIVGLVMHVVVAIAVVIVEALVFVVVVVVVMVVVVVVGVVVHSTQYRVQSCS